MHQSRWTAGQLRDFDTSAVAGGRCRRRLHTGHLRLRGSGRDGCSHCTSAGSDGRRNRPAVRIRPFVRRRRELDPLLEVVPRRVRPDPGHLRIQGHRQPQTRWMCGSYERRQLTGRAELTRGLAVVGLVGITLCHLVQLPSTFRESPALGWLFAALSLVAALLAAGLVHADHQLLWYLAGLTAAGALAGYALTRLVALPFDTDDVGNWLEPPRVGALFGGG